MKPGNASDQILDNSNVPGLFDLLGRLVLEFEPAFLGCLMLSEHRVLLDGLVGGIWRGMIRLILSEISECVWR